MESVQQAVSGIIDAVTPASAQPPQEPEGWLLASQVEQIQPDEDEKAQQIGEKIRKMQNHNFDQHQHKFRGTHVSIGDD